MEKRITPEDIIKHPWFIKNCKREGLDLDTSKLAIEKITKFRSIKNNKFHYRLINKNGHEVLKNKGSSMNLTSSISALDLDSNSPKSQFFGQKKSSSIEIENVPSRKDTPNQRREFFTGYKEKRD